MLHIVHVIACMFLCQSFQFWDFPVKDTKTILPIIIIIIIIIIIDWWKEDSFVDYLGCFIRLLYWMQLVGRSNFGIVF